MAAAARRARLEESWAWVDAEVEEYEGLELAHEPMTLAPLYAAVDSIVDKNPTLQLRRHTLDAMVTRLVEQVGENPTDDAIAKAAGLLEETLVQKNRVGATAVPRKMQTRHSSQDGSKRGSELLAHSRTSNQSLRQSTSHDSLGAGSAAGPSTDEEERAATPEEEDAAPVLHETDPLCSIDFDGLAASDDQLVRHCCVMAKRLGMEEALGVGQAKIEEYFQACRKQMHTADKGCAFHNWHHVADVTQCLYTVLLKTGLNNALTTEQLIAVFLAAPAHDLDHRGRSNALEIAEETDIAKEFPDEKVRACCWRLGICAGCESHLTRARLQGPLENHHARLALKTLDDTDILANLSDVDKRVVRACLKNGILATDMGRHGAIMNGFKESIADLENEESNLRAADFFIPGEKGWLMLGMLLKCCDVSNPGRPISTADKWNMLVYDEFYAEGDIDRQRGRPLNPLHDKENNNIAKSSVGFIGFVVCPIYMIIKQFLAACCTEHANIAKELEGVHSAQKKSRRGKPLLTRRMWAAPACAEGRAAAGRCAQHAHAGDGRLVRIDDRPGGAAGLHRFSRGKQGCETLLVVCTRELCADQLGVRQVHMGRAADDAAQAEAAENARNSLRTLKGVASLVRAELRRSS